MSGNFKVLVRRCVKYNAFGSKLRTHPSFFNFLSLTIGCFLWHDSDRTLLSCYSTERRLYRALSQLMAPLLSSPKSLHTTRRQKIVIDYFSRIRSTLHSLSITLTNRDFSCAFFLLSIHLVSLKAPCNDELPYGILQFIFFKSNW